VNRAWRAHSWRDGRPCRVAMEALATELGALTPEQAVAPVNTVEVSNGGDQLTLCF